MENPEITETTNKEIELKLEITFEIYSNIINQFSTTYSSYQENYFFDTEDLIVNKQRWALRLRFQDGKAFLTAKGPRINNQDEHIRPEYEVEIPLTTGKKMLDGIDLNTENYLPLNMLLKTLSGKLGKTKLSPLLHFSNQRIHIPWKLWILELDKTTIGDKIFYELEIESEIRLIDNLKNQIGEFFNINGWEIKYSKIDKFTRALEILL